MTATYEDTVSPMTDPVTITYRDAPLESKPLDQLKAEQRALRNRIRCIRTNQQHPDPLRVTREYERDRERWVAKLDRLSGKRKHGAELLSVYRKKLEDWALEYKRLEAQPKLKRMLDMIRQINEANGVGSQSTSLMNALETESVARERRREITYMSASYRMEIIEVKRAMSGAFEQTEAKYAAAVELLDRNYTQFLHDRLHGDAYVADCCERLEALRVAIAAREEETRIEQYSAALDEIKTLLGELTPDQVRIALGLPS